MMGSFRNQSQPSKNKQDKGWLGRSFQPENFIPGLIIGFIFGMLMDLSKPIKRNAANSRRRLLSSSNDENLKMVLVVRQDLKMGQGKIASQCAHAATGLYSQLMQSHRNLLHRWEACGQAKIVVTCKNEQEMNKLQNAADGIGLPTFVVADAGRTQAIFSSKLFFWLLNSHHLFWVSAGSKTALAIGPGYNSVVDSITGKQRLL
ncbi:hypothetical protein OSB04_019312 [Centaurea solstitialis]|uniref:peptidyl-tRNA hydrolase n=1 Tax=Centaurea solstitialis TaxID=347529 RepID=A0AA38WE48_9ASTR|nr:hypothetical protein OSB04_019312 [Centaurea solstitialis]